MQTAQDRASATLDLTRLAAALAVDRAEHGEYPDRLSYGQARDPQALGLRLTINSFMHVAVPVVFGAIGSIFGMAPVFWINSLLLAGSGIWSRPKTA